MEQPYTGELKIFVKSNDYPQTTQMRKWIAVRPQLTIGEIMLCDPDYVIPKWPTFFILHASYVDKFMALDIDKIR